MTKFKYPITGLYGPCKIYIDGASSKIKSAVNASNLSVPLTFSHRNYLNGLKSSLSSLGMEMDVISRLLRKADNSYKLMSQEIESNMSKMEFKNIKERERMIK